jgi:hypothetical protein
VRALPAVDADAQEAALLVVASAAILAHSSSKLQ